MALGFTLIWLILIVLIPISGLLLKTSSLGWGAFWSIASDPRVLAALRMSFGGALVAAVVNAIFGVILAWVLVRYNFPESGSSMPSLTCPSRCRRPSPVSR